MRSAHAAGPVLVTGALGPAGASLLRQLAELGVPATGVDMAAHDSDSDSRCRPVPAASDPDFVRVLADHARRIRAGLVVPTVSEELPVLARPAARRIVAVPVLLAPREGVDLAHDKLHTCRALARRDVPVPLHLAGDELACDDDPADRLGSPYVAKPRVGRGGRGVQLHEAGQRPATDARRVLQEFVPDTEYAVDLYLPTGPGRTVAVVLAKTALAQGAIGNATAVERVDAPDVAAVATRAAETLGLTGPADVDVRRRDDGTPVVLEVNARFGAHSAHAPEVLEAALTEHLLSSRSAA